MSGERVKEFQIQLSLTFYTDHPNVESIASAISAVPSMIRLKGEKDPERGIPVHSYVVYESTALEWGAPLEDHWADLENRLEFSWSELRSLAKISDAVVLLVLVDTSDGWPPTYLSTHIINRVLELSAEIEVRGLVD